MSSLPPPPDLDALLADLRAGGLGEESRRYPTELPERFRTPPTPPPGAPPRGIFDEALARVRGEFNANEPDLFGKRYEPPAEVTSRPDPGKIQKDFEEQVAAGAKQVGATGGDVEEYVNRQHAARYGPEIASMLKAGRDLAHQRLAQGASPEEAENAGTELAQRHIENLKNRLASGELGEHAADTEQNVEGLTSSFTTRKGLAKQGLYLGVPMAVGALASGPLGWGALGTFAATAAATTASQAAEEKLIEGRAPDWESATAAGLAYSIPIPGVGALARGEAGIANPLLRRAASTLAHAGTQAVEMPLRTGVQNLVEGRPLPSAIEAETQAATGAIVGAGVGGGMGLLEGAREHATDQTAGATDVEANPPTRALGRAAEATADGQLEEIERSLAAARGAADLNAIQALEGARQAILDARARNSDHAVTPDPPAPGEAGPPPAQPTGPAIPPPGAPGAPPPPGPPVPGPVADVHLRPQVPEETAAGAAGETTPEEAAGARQAGTAPQVRGLTEEARVEASGAPAAPAPPVVRGPTSGAARGVETTPEVPRTPAEPLAGRPAAPGPPGAPPAPPGPPSPAPEPVPARRLKIGRGANGQVDVIFPDKNHADLFSLPGRARRAAEGQPNAVPPDAAGISARMGIPPDLVGQAGARYKDAVMEALGGIPAGETFNAPSFRDVMRPPPPPPGAVPPLRAAVPPLPEPPPAPAAPAEPSRIILRPHEGVWIAHHEGPIAAEVEKAMGANAIPTPFRTAMPGADVAARIKKINPNVEVTVEEPPGHGQEKGALPGITTPEGQESKERGARRERRATELSQEEAAVAAAPPGEVPWPTADSLEIAKDWYANGKQGANLALYRAIATAKQLGEPVHPDWLKVFPDVENIETTGRRQKTAVGEYVPPAKPAHALEQRRAIASLPDDQRKAVETAIKRLPEPVREQAAGHVEEQLARRQAVLRAEDDHDYFRRNAIDPVSELKIVNRGAKRAAAKARADNARAIYEAGWETVRGLAKDSPEADAIVKRLRQVAENKGIREAREPEPPPPLTRGVYLGVQGFVDQHPEAPPLEEAVKKVKEYQGAYPRTAEDVLPRMERLSGTIQNLGDAALRNLIDIPGLGRGKIAKALANPKSADFAKIQTYLQEVEAQERAARELYAEHDDRTIEHPHLNSIADALEEDRAKGDVAEGENGLIKTFMWGVDDPKTGQQVEEPAALAAIRDGKGRLFQRIRTAYEDAAAAYVNDIPFDIPEGGAAPDEIMESPSRFEFVAAAQDPFNGRYGPPPRKLTPEQLEARRAWAASMLRGEAGGTEIPAPRTAAAPARVEGEAPAEAVGPEPGGEGEHVGPGEARGGGGGGRGRAGAPVRERGAGEPREAAAAAEHAARPATRTGIFQIINPRERETLKHPARYELIPPKLVPHLSDEQRLGVAKAIEAIDAGSGFLFQDGTGVGKTRELLATAYNYAQKGKAVLIVSKSSAIEPTKDARTGKWSASGSYADDAAAMEVPINFTKERGVALKPGTITLGTYHRLRDYVVDKNTVLFFDEAHQLKNMGDSEVAAEGIDQIRRAGVTGFATATPGDKAYHLGYLASIGLFEGKPPEQALKDLGLQAKTRKRVSPKLYKQYLKEELAGAQGKLDRGELRTPKEAADAIEAAQAKARERASEEFQVWKATSPVKHRKALEALFDRLTERGTVIKREVDLSPVQVQTVVVPLSEEGRAAMKTIEEGKFDRKGALMHMRRQQEPFKLDKVKDLVRQELADGKQVVVFASRVNESEVIERGRDQHGNPYERSLMKSEGTLKTLGDWLDKEGIPYSEIHGEAKESSKDAQARFQAGQAKVVIATYEKGGTGINLDDRSGAAPRTMVLMTAPFGATDIVQAIGRVHRYTTRTPSKILVLYSDHGVDLWNAAVIGGKLKQHHAQVSGDIAALDLGNTSADEDALSAGSGHYMDVAAMLGDHGASGMLKDIWSARHYGKIVRQIRDLGVKYTLRGGDFEIPTHEGFTISGSLEKTPNASAYARLLWNHDEEAGDLRLAAAVGPQRPPANAPATGYALNELRELGGEPEKVKPIVSNRQHDFIKRRLNALGASWGVAELPGSFQVITKEGQFFTGELAPPKREVFGRAPRGEEGAFWWKNLGGEARVEEPAAQAGEEPGTTAALERFSRAGEPSQDPAGSGALAGVVGSPVPSLVLPDLRWGRPARLGAGVAFRPGEETPGGEGTQTLATALREGFTKLGRIEWKGQHVRNIDDAGALFHTARNPSLEHAALFFVDDQGRIAATKQVTSDAPSFVNYGSTRAHYEDVRQIISGLKDQGVTVEKVYSLHNHPSGEPRPSEADMRQSAKNAEVLGELYGGAAIIDHEKIAVIKPDGARYDITKQAGGFADPDPYLAEGVDTAAFYDPKRPGMIGAKDLSAFSRSLLDQGLWKQGSTDVSVAFLDPNARVRLVTLVPEAMFTNSESWERFSDQVGKATGATAIYAATDGGFKRNPLVSDAATHYMSKGLLQEMVDLQSPQVPSRLLRGTGMKVPTTYRYSSNDRLSPLGGTRLEDSTNAFEPADSAYPEWEKPAPDWWDRRLAFAKARMEERMRGTTAAVGVDPRTFWDAFVMGVDAIRNGARRFGDWMSKLGGEIPGFGAWGRRVWDYISGLNAPVEVARPAAVRPFGDLAAAAEAPLYRGPIRPIPGPTVRDLAAATEALLRGQGGEPVDVGAGKPLGIGVPGDLAVNINNVKDESGIRENMARIVRAVEKRFDLARQKFTGAELHQLALALGYDEADYLRMVRQKGALTAPEIIAGRILRQHAGVDFANKMSVWQDAAARAKEAGLPEVETQKREIDRLEAEREKQAALHKFIAVMYGTAAAGSEVGRALWAHKLMISQLTPEERFMQKLLRSGRADEQQMGALAEAFAKNDQQSVSRLVRRIYKPGFGKMAIEYFINSLLSAPPTFVANVTGNLIHEAFMRTPERGVAAQLEKYGIRQGVERLLTGEAKPTERVVGQAMESLRAQVRHKFGIFAALDMARQALTKEDLRFLQSVKQEAYVPAIPGLLGKVVRTPGRIMEALDIGAKISAASAEKAAQLWKLAYDDAGGQGLGSPEFKEHLAELHQTMDQWISLEIQRREDPRAFREEHGAEGYKFLYKNRDLADVYKQMQHAADVSTFRDETSRFTNFIKQMRNAYPALTFVVPFVHTTERILVQGFRRTPLGLAKTLYNIKEGRVSGGEASDRLAQGLIGSMLSAGIYMWAADGHVTGGGPNDPRERENWLKTGKLPYALKFGNAWVSYSRVEPFATIFGMAADVAEAKDEKTAGDAFGKLHYAIMNNITNKTYLEGLVSAAEAVGNPDRYMNRYWKRSLGAIVPNLLATAARAIDPTIRETDDFSQVLMSRVPILSEDLPPRLTGTGETAVRGENAVSRMLSPVRYSEEAGPEKNLERLFLETGYSPSQPPKRITLPGTMGRQVDLTRQEREIYAGFAQRASNFARTVAQDKDWSRLDAYGKEEFLKRIFRTVHDSADRAMLASVMGRMRQGQTGIAPRTKGMPVS